MAGGRTERHIDDEYLISGKHDGATSTTLRHMGADFASCGVLEGLYIENVTQGKNSLVVTATEDEVTTTAASGTEAFVVTDAGGETFVVTDAGGEDFNVVQDTTMSWDRDDVYEIYKTGVKDSLLSTERIDVSRGWRADPEKLINGWFPDDLDIDRNNPGKVFGPGQPEGR